MRKRNSLQAHVPIFQDVPEYDSITKYIVGGIIVFTLILGMVMIPYDITGAAVMFGLTLFDAALMHSILPRRLQIFENRLKITLGWPFAINIFFDNIEETGQAENDAAWIYSGMRFATSSKYLIEVKRRKGLNIIFSPSRREEFLRELIQAKANYREPDFSVFFKI